MENYSQNNEQAEIIKFFNGHVGTFLDIGANDGITLSNTRALYLLGWRGVLIDASHEAIVRCRDLYRSKVRKKSIYIYEWAITNRFENESVEDFNESGPLCSAADIGLVSTFHVKEMDRFKTSVKYNPIKALTFHWLTAYNRMKIKNFDFISIDIEGEEMFVLPDIDLSETKLLCIEHNGSEERKNQYLECTSKFGMNRIIYESPENLLICR